MYIQIHVLVNESDCSKLAIFSLNSHYMYFSPQVVLTSDNAIIANAANNDPNPQPSGDTVQFSVEVPATLQPGGVESVVMTGDGDNSAYPKVMYLQG